MNIIPVIAKADTMTAEEIAHFKKQIMNQVQIPSFVKNAFFFIWEKYLLKILLEILFFFVPLSLPFHL